MTREEAIRILDPETRRETMRQIPVFERIDADQEACMAAVAALRAQRPAKLDRRVQELSQAEKDGRLVVMPPNDPLTLEELREMDGDPVWVELIGIKRPSAWYLLNLRDKEAVNKRGGFVSLINYGNTWLAYRRRPEEGMTY